MKQFPSLLFAVFSFSLLTANTISAQQNIDATPWTQIPAMGDVIAGPWDAAENTDFVTIGSSQGMGFLWVSAVLIQSNTPYIIQLELDGTIRRYHKLSVIGINNRLSDLTFNTEAALLQGVSDTALRAYSLNYNHSTESLSIVNDVDLSAYIVQGAVVGIASSKKVNGDMWVAEMYNLVNTNTRLHRFNSMGDPMQAPVDIGGLNAFAMDLDAATGTLWIGCRFGANDVKFIEFDPEANQVTGRGFNSHLPGTPTGLSIHHDTRNTNGLSLLAHIAQPNSNTSTGQLVLYDHNDFITGNQDASLQVYGTAIGKPVEVVLKDATPGRLVYIVGSTVRGTDTSLNEISSEGNDTLAVQGPFIYGDLRQPLGTIDANGEFNFSEMIRPGMAGGNLQVGAAFYLQAFTGDPNAGTPEEFFADFTNVFTVYPNMPGNWGEEESFANGPKTPGMRTKVYQFGINGGVEKLLTFGGANHLYPKSGEPVIATNEIWDMNLQTGENTLIARMNVARAHHKLQRLPDGRIFITGGMVGPHPDDPNQTGITRRAEIFNPYTSEVTEVAPMSTPRSHHFGFLLPDGRIFVAGGVTGKNNNGKVENLGTMTKRNTKSSEIYDPATDSWTAGPNLPYRIAAVAIAGIGHGTGLRLFFGGLTNGDVTNRVCSFNVETLNYTEWTPMQEARAFFSKNRATATEYVLAGGVTSILNGEDYDFTASSELYDITATTDDGQGGFTFGGTVATDPLPEPIGFTSTASLLRPDINGNYTVHILGGVGVLRGTGMKHYTFNAGQTAGNQYQSEDRTNSSHSGGSVTTNEDGTVTVRGGDVAGPNGQLPTFQSYTPQ
ncbi:MAG: kelch repeat-containing protein [Planctomycetota bacterium]|nr:kelch repeat-containing protein [Planctomycetota bacterium]